MYSLERAFGVAVVFVGLLATVATTAAQSSTPDRKAPASAAQQKTVQMRIAGMTCAACAKGLEASFRNMAGIEKAAVDYKAGQAVITFDPGKQSTESLTRFIASCGYQVKETKVV